jgi:ParB/RepB/Spo0J family partition protein
MNTPIAGSKNKLESGLNILTETMSKDFNQAQKMKNETQQKIATASKIERLRKFVGHVASIDINEIKTNKNVRQNLETGSDEFKILLESITKNGVQQNLIIEFKETNDDKGYSLTCVAGHRRLAAAKLAKLNTVPCLIRTFENEVQKLEVALAENLLREGLHVLDIADGYKRLLDLGWSKDDIQKYFDRNQKTIRYYLKIAHWPIDAKELIRNNSTLLPGRLIMRKYACKKFNNDNELITALKSELELSDDKKQAAKRISFASKVQSYLETKRYSIETKEIIWKLLQDLQLVKDIPKKD